MRKATILGGLAAAGILIAAASASATTINFNDLTTAGTTVQSVGQSINESGFNFTEQGAFGFAVFQTGESRFPGATALFDNTVGGLTTLSKIGGGQFNLTSIDLANLNFVGADSATFTGLKNGQTVATQTVNFNSFQHLTTEALTGFTGVDAVQFVQNTQPFYQFDNLVVDDTTPVPEPASLALFGVGLGFGGIALRRRRSREHPPSA
jgi:hypothetical protein